MGVALSSSLGGSLWGVPVSRALPVLMYHHVCPASGLVTVSPDIFRDQMGALVKAGWQTLGCAELADFFAGKSLLGKRLVLTFDDGYLDNYIHAFPVLKEFGLKAIIFLVSDWIGDGEVRSDASCPDHGECKRRIAAGDADSVILRWSEIRKMQASGLVEFQSHTHTHTRWDRSLPDGMSRLEAIVCEMRESKKRLEEELGCEVTHLCWPQGYFQEDYLPLAQKSGFNYIYTTRRGTNRLGGDAMHIRRIVTKDKDGRWLLKRLSIYGSLTLAWVYDLFRRA